jgi:hypothetical protein
MGIKLFRQNLLVMVEMHLCLCIIPLVSVFFGLKGKGRVMAESSRGQQWAEFWAMIRKESKNVKK